VHPKLRRTIIGNRGKNIDRAVNIVRRLSDAKNIKVVSEQRRKPRRGRPSKFEKAENKQEAPKETEKETKKESVPENNE